MPLSRTEARDAILTLVKAGLDQIEGLDSANVIWDATKGRKPSSDDSPAKPWARVVLRHLQGEQGTLAGALGRQRYDRRGLLTVQWFGVTGRGLDEIDAQVRIIENTVQGRTTLGGVWFRNVRSQEIGEDGPWFQTNVLAEFEYDEVA